MIALALAAILAADGGADAPLDAVSLIPTHAVIRQLDGGVETVDALACMAPDTAQALDFGLRSAELERDDVRSSFALWVGVATAAGVVSGVVLGVVSAYVLKK